MPAQESTQPQAQQMAVPATVTEAQQPAAAEQMTAEPMSIRGGGDGELCCGICAGLACFECCECCC